MTAIHRTLLTPVQQTLPLDERQVKNSAGGYVYQLDPEAHFDRFLILGTTGGTYYASEAKLTREGIALCQKLAQDLDPATYANHVINAAETAPRRTFAIYAVAAALNGPTALRQLAPAMAERVCKTGTDVFELASYVKGLDRGWGATVQRTFDRFLDEKDAGELALWAVKYRSRNGWTWRDLVRLQHPKAHQGIYGFMTGKTETTGQLVIDGYLKVQGVADEHEIIEIVKAHGLPWEALTDEQRSPAVWKATLPFLGNWAVLRNLATFTRLGLGTEREFVTDVGDRIRVAKRLHPVTVLDALKTYQSGGTVGRSRGGAFTPVRQWNEALSAQLETSFTRGVEATGQNVLVAIDVSGSMKSNVAGSAVLSCREVAAALGLAMIKNEPWARAIAFSDGKSVNMSRERIPLLELNWTKQTSFADAMRQTKDMPFGATDCSAPILYALQHGAMEKVDTFVVITDNETWAGHVHPMQALRDYRRKVNPKAKLAVVGLTATRHTIADPADPGSMDFVGFSSDLPKALAAFMSMV